MSTGPAGRPARYPQDARAVGEVPGYEFETPHPAIRESRQDAPAGSASPVRQDWPRRDQPYQGQPYQGQPYQDRPYQGQPHPDPLHRLRRPEPSARKPPSLPFRVARAALAAMRARNWVTGLAIPVLAAVLVGVAAVVFVGGGGGGGTAPSALDAGFPPARLAGTDFAGATAASPVVFDAIAASAGTEVAAGSAGGGPALWVSADGGSSWARAALGGAAARTMAGNGALAGVAQGAAGWLAVGTALPGRRSRAASGPSGPIVASSPDGQTWTVSDGPAALPGADASTAAAAAAMSPAGSVIVGHQSAGGTSHAVAWYAPAGPVKAGKAGWRRAAVTRASPRAGAAEQMNAVTATARGFAAAGGAGAGPAAWLSADGRNWRRVTLPLPDGAAHAAFTYVAASGAAVVAVGTEVSPAGETSPFAEISGDAGATWRQAPLPGPAPGAGSAGGTAGAAGAAGTAANPVKALTVTALAAAGGGFTAMGTYSTPGAEGVVVWTLPSAGRAGAGWRAAAPAGTGLTGRGTQAITALTAEGATLTGLGFTAVPGVRQPTLWQSPIRD